MTTANHSPDRPRVVQLSYACSPVRGSEAGVGWQRAVQSAKHFDTWVICEEHEFAGEIRQYIETHGDIPGLHFVFVPIDQREWSWGQVHDSLWYIALHHWHRQAYRVARRLHEQINFDLAHQVTFCGYREPGYLWKLDIPFVWGPIGGTQDYPWRFLPSAGIHGAIKETCRSVVNNLQLRFNWRVRRAARTAAVVMAANSTNRHRFGRAHGIDLPIVPDVGINGCGSVVHKQPRHGPIRILWSGMLAHHKALHLLIRALARLPDDVPCELRVLGRGRLQSRLQTLAKRMGVAEHITWLGWLPHREALEQYAWADVFVFSSLRDTTGTVVVEALSAGLPVICLDHQGVHDVVTNDCGLKIPVTTPRKVIAALGEAIVQLARDEPKRQRMAVQAVERAREYLWPCHEKQMTEVYRRVLAGQLKSRTSKGRGNHSETRESPPVALAANLNSRQSTALDPFNGEISLRSIMHTQRDKPFGILMYHRIAPRIAGVSPPTWNVTPESFRRQLRGLLSRGYRPWPLRRVLDCHQSGEPVPARTFVVTFVDGYDSVYHNAWPILKELSVPATVFLVTACLDTDRPFASDDWVEAGSTAVPTTAWNLLTTAHCAEMLDHGLMEFGSHTHTHTDFRGRNEAFREDLARSLAVLRETLGVEHASFAFPFGYYDSDLVAAVREGGVRCALTTDQALATSQADPFMWGRFGVAENDTTMTLALKLNGWYSVARDAWQWLRRPWRARRTLFGRQFTTPITTKQSPASGKLISL